MKNPHTPTAKCVQCDRVFCLHCYTKEQAVSNEYRCSDCNFSLGTPLRNQVKRILKRAIRNRDINLTSSQLESLYVTSILILTQQHDDIAIHLKNMVDVEMSKPRNYDFLMYEL